MEKFTVNDQVVIYPNDKGWDKIHDLIREKYRLSNQKTFDFIEGRKFDGGYRDQMWTIMSDLHSMYFNGQNYFSNTYIAFSVDEKSSES